MRAYRDEAARSQMMVHIEGQVPEVDEILADFEHALIIKSIRMNQVGTTMRVLYGELSQGRKLRQRPKFFASRPEPVAIGGIDIADGDPKTNKLGQRSQRRYDWSVVGMRDEGQTQL